MKNRWAVFALTLVITTIGMIAFASVFPLLNLWIRDWQITRAQGGLLSGFWYLPGLLFSLPAGWAFDRYPIRRVLLLCWVLIAGGTTLMAIAPSFWVLCAGRLLFSIGMNAHLIGAPKLLGLVFAGRRELGFVIGVYTMAFTAGVFLALNQLGAIGAARGWRPAMQLAAGLTVLGLALTALVPGGRAEVDSENPRVQFNPLALGIGAWLLATAYFGFSIGTDAFLTFGPDALVSRGMELAQASAMIGSYAIVAVILKPIVSTQLKVGTAGVFVLVATLAALVGTGLLFAPGLPPRAATVAMGVAFAFGMPSFVALPSFLYPAERSGQVYGLYQTLYSLGFLGQPLVGWVVDRTGSYGAGFAVVAGYCTLGFLVAPALVRRPKLA